VRGDAKIASQEGGARLGKGRWSLGGKGDDLRGELEGGNSIGEDFKQWAETIGKGRRGLTLRGGSGGRDHDERRKAIRLSDSRDGVMGATLVTLAQSHRRLLTAPEQSGPNGSEIGEEKSRERESRIGGTT